MQVEQKLRHKLTQIFHPLKLDIVNESYLHQGHRESSTSKESHFKIFIVSESFNGLNFLHRHRRVYEVLEEELRGPLHALSLKTLTPEEMDKKLEDGRYMA